MERWNKPTMTIISSVRSGKSCRLDILIEIYKTINRLHSKDYIIYLGSFTCRWERKWIKSNHFIQITAQVPWWVKFLWACSRQCRKTTDNLPMDRQCKKTTNNLHMDRQCKKLHWSIYSAPDSAKKTTTAIYIWTDSAKKQQQFTYGQYIFTDCTEDNVQNTHTYTQYT